MGIFILVYEADKVVCYFHTRKDSEGNLFLGKMSLASPDMRGFLCQF